MKRSSFNASLPTVNSLSSHDSQHSSSQNNPLSSNNAMDIDNNRPITTQSRMKRSPYLSAMTTEREQHEGGEDLVALLSRPARRTDVAAGGG
eukprot:CAMPEP_0201691456 /NCGR_PEP_ID=MMETSP0578-20130828/4610_1 /ASSEMBLY_ACC=CAM_ASM_000663 /TAXON_ID=267565 /ORGANISM="Skeletonema grethea, Strain CCMP 1804" /LENGTH=91 /DNA_ID=CAMNT_0048176661 /DNA_START=96 /DNA_END=367 /DNA_ORIENTATION=+